MTFVEIMSTVQRISSQQASRFEEVVQDTHERASDICRSTVSRPYSLQKKQHARPAESVVPPGRLIALNRSHAKMPDTQSCPLRVSLRSASRDGSEQTNPGWYGHDEEEQEGRARVARGEEGQTAVDCSGCAVTLNRPCAVRRRHALDVVEGKRRHARHYALLGCHYEGFSAEQKRGRRTAER